MLHLGTITAICSGSNQSSVQAPAASCESNILSAYRRLQLAPEDLPRSRARQGLNKLHNPRVLVGSHLSLRPLDNFLLRDLATLLLAKYHQGFDRLSTSGVHRGDHASLLYGRVLVEGRFHLGGPDFEATGIDHPLEPIHHKEVAFIVVHSRAARAQDPLAIECEKDFLGCFRLPPVALHD